MWGALAKSIREVVFFLFLVLIATEDIPRVYLVDDGLEFLAKAIGENDVAPAGKSGEALHRFDSPEGRGTEFWFVDD